MRRSGLLAKLIVHPALNPEAADFFPASYSRRIKRLSRYGTANRIVASILGPMLDVPAGLGQLLIRLVLLNGTAFQATLADDRALKASCDRACSAVWHPVGTCRMGDPSDPKAVVAPEGLGDRQRQYLRGGRFDHAAAADGQYQHSRDHGGREDRRCVACGGFDEALREPPISSCQLLEEPDGALRVTKSRRRPAMKVLIKSSRGSGWIDKAGCLPPCRRLRRGGASKMRIFLLGEAELDEGQESIRSAVRRSVGRRSPDRARTARHAESNNRVPITTPASSGLSRPPGELILPASLGVCTAFHDGNGVIRTCRGHRRIQNVQHDQAPGGRTAAHDAGRRHRVRLRDVVKDNAAGAGAVAILDTLGCARQFAGAAHRGEGDT